MAIVSKGGGGGGGPGGGATQDAGGGTPEVRTNLPPRTGPVCGRRAEMQGIVDAFAGAQQAKRCGLVEVTGEPGRGATSVAVELARRAGGRFPGGAWLLRADLGPELAWADLAACRGETVTRSLAETAAAERSRQESEPRSLLVIDGVTPETDLDAFLPSQENNGADVFVVTTARTGRIDDVVEVGPVPDHAPRRIAHAVLRVRDGDDLEPPVVRVTDGLAITASLAARVAVAHHPDGPPRSMRDLSAAVMQIVPLAGQHATALELLLVCAVAHPTLLSADAIYGAVAHLRKRNGAEMKDQEIGTGVLHLVRLGLLGLDEESRVSMHPLLQEVVRGMARDESDLCIARDALGAGLIAEAEASIGEDGVEVRRAGLHQLRHLRDATAAALAAREDSEDPAARQRLDALDTALGERLVAAIGKVEDALGVAR